MTDESRFESPPGGPERLINLLALVFNTGFAILVVVTLAGIVFITRPNFVMHDIRPELWLPLLIVMGPAQIYSQYLSWRTVAGGETPSGPNVAMRQHAIPFGLRTVVAFVWASNFVIELGIIISLSKPHPGKPPPAGADFVLIGVLAFWFALAANVFLHLALRTLGADERILRQVWRYRLWIDLTCAVFAAMYWN